MTALDNVLAALAAAGSAARRSGDGWSARCPAHDDTDPSLAISNGAGKVLIKCHAGCELQAVLAALGLQLVDLFDAKRPSRNAIAAIYEYTDKSGTLLFQVVRKDGKQFLQRRPDGLGDWVWKLGDVERPLYRLPAVIEAVKNGEQIFVPEGEKDVLALLSAGFVATTNPGGAGKWRPNHAEALRGAEVIVIADKDQPGYDHARAVRESLEGIASRVIVAEALSGKDVSDHLAAGHTVADLVVIWPTVADTPPPTLPGPPARAPTLAVRWIRDAIASPPPEPPVLIDGMLRAGELCVIGASRGVGKSWASANAGVLLGRGEGNLFGALPIVKRARVLIAQGELDEWESSRRWSMLTGSGEVPDGVAETFDRWRLRTTRCRSSFGSSDGGDHSNESSEWIDAVLDGRLEATIAEHGFEVLVIDPWKVYFAGAENSNDEVEAALDKLRDLAMRYLLAVVILHHLGKSTEAREPEDLWRGASRLADWASTRVTFLPHYTEAQARDQGMTREQARRYVNVRFLRRSAPTEDFSMVLDPTSGWWDRWAAPQEVADSRRIHLEVDDVVDALTLAGGAWSSQRAAAIALNVSEGTARKILGRSISIGAIETARGERGAMIYRLPGDRLDDVEGSGT